MRQWMWFAVLRVFAAVVVADGRLVNVTIDDTSGDERTGVVPTYSSVHLWNSRSATDGCTTCGAQPDGSRFVDQTWHDETTYENQTASNVSMSFIGTSIRIYCALANEVNMGPRKYRETHLAFYLDDSAAPAVHFDHLPTADIGFLYDQLVYESNTLPLGEHKILVSNLATADMASFILFDYAVYTTEVTDDPRSSAPDTPPPRASQSNSPVHGESSQTHVGAIAGAVAASLSTFLIVCAAVWYYRRRARRRGEPTVVTPYTVSNLARRPPERGRPLSTWKSKIALTQPSVSQTPPSLAVIQPDPGLAMEVARLRAELERARRVPETPPRYQREAWEAQEQS